MATCQQYNCDTLGTYESTLDNCSTIRKGGSSQAALIACGTTMADSSDEAELTALVAADNAWIIENVKIGLSVSSQDTVDPVTSCGTSKVVNNVYTGTLFSAVVSENNTEFINKLIAGYVVGGMILKICDTDGLAPMQIYIDAEVSFSGGLVLPDTNADVIRYEVNFTFKSNSIATVAANPYFD